ncbi:MAG: hypothetical protein HOY69_07095 [Streptomyces sp.]|nr:hypothetical protein [Streptomyces sp.]
MTVRSEQLPIKVSGCRERTGPLTYGQAYIWNSIRGLALEDQHNLVMSFPLDEPVDRADVTTALSRLLAAHESLRTTLCPAGTGLPEQSVAGDGVLPLDLVEADGERPPDAAEARRILRGAGFDHAHEWPIRAGVLCVAGRPRWLVLTISHLATDASGARLLRRHLTSLLDGGQDAGGIDLTCRQPLDQAAHERSSEGERRARRALDHWQRQLEEFPLFDRPALAPEQPRFWQGMLISDAVAEAAPAIARRTGTSVYSVLLAAVTVVLGRRAGRDRYAVGTMCSNRHTAELKDSVMNLPQRVLVAVDLGGTFDEVVRRTHVAALNSYRFGMYDPTAARELTAGVARRRMGPLDVHTTFNAIEPLWHDHERAELGGTTRTFVWTRKTDTDMERLRFVDFFAPDRIAMYADTRYYPISEIESCLWEVERTVTEAVTP